MIQSVLGECCYELFAMVLIMGKGGIKMSILAKHAQGKGGPDPIFAYGGMAADRAAEIGKENIINATIGAFLNPDGSLATLKTVEAALNDVPFNVIAGYPPIYGLPEYIKDMIDSVLREYRPNAFIDGIATPGGTGALHNAFFNYLNEGDTCLTTSYFWGNYAALLSENGRKLKTFNTFTPEGGFDIDACIESCKAMAGTQENLMLLLNTPAHNPTGLTVSYEEWQSLVKELAAIATDKPNHGVVLVVDVAYIDFSAKENRRFFTLFENLPENMIVVVCASMSKGYTLYGFRLGIEFCIAPTEEAKNEFLLANGATARSVWSNCSRPAMEVIINLYSTPEKLAAFRSEQDSFADALAKRAAVFTEEAKEVGLKICPYDSGFFIYVPTADFEHAEKLAEKVREKDIFTVPLGPGVRIAICAIDEKQIVGMARIFKEAQDALGF